MPVKGKTAHFDHVAYAKEQASQKRTQDVDRTLEYMQRHWRNPDRLLSSHVTAERLAISTRAFYFHRSKLIAKGLVQVRVGRDNKYTEASLNRIIREAAETGEPLY